MNKEILALKDSFVVFKNDPSYIYFDNSSTTQKPKNIFKYIRKYINKSYSNVHRGLYKSALKTDKLWLNAHKYIAQYLNASSYKDVFFVKNTTEGFNILANSLSSNLSKDDVVVISILEHHSNYIPWFVNAKKFGFKLEVLKLNKELDPDIEQLKKLYEQYGERIKILSLTQQSNVIGKIIDVVKYINLAKKYNTLTIIDGAQSIAHTKVDVKKLGCDAYVFSGHKVYGPSGTGVVYVSDRLKEILEPVFYGGDMISSFDGETLELADFPFRYESGTPAIEAHLGLSEALEWYSKIVDRVGGWEEYTAHQYELTKYCIEQVKGISQIKIISSEEALGVISFTIDKIHPHDICTLLGEKNIAVRGGYHCAQPLHKYLGLNTGTVRVSFGIYNSKEEVDQFILAILEIIKKFN